MDDLLSACTSGDIEQVKKYCFFVNIIDIRLIEEGVHPGIGPKYGVARNTKCYKHVILFSNYKCGPTRAFGDR